MKRLTKEEIQFVKDTGFTPTVYQCDEYYKTIFTDEKVDSTECGDSYREKRDAYAKKYFKIACDYAAKKYGIDLPVFVNKNIGVDLHDTDAISLEYTAVYLLYSFFTLEELRKLDGEKATQWLKDYRYFFGFRKWFGSSQQYIDDAIKAHQGFIKFYEDYDGNVWWRTRYE